MRSWKVFDKDINPYPFLVYGKGTVTWASAISLFLFKRARVA